MRPGPTGDFPKGKIRETDEGGLAIAVSETNGTVLIDFGKKIAWVGMPREMCINFACMLLKHCGVSDYVLQQIQTDPNDRLALPAPSRQVN